MTWRSNFHTRPIGLGVTGFGLILLVYCVFYFNLSSHRSGVGTLVLIADRQIGVIVCCVLVLVGLVILALSKPPRVA